MTDTLLERIKAGNKWGGTCADASYVREMEARIIADAEIIKAAKELAEAELDDAFLGLSNKGFAESDLHKIAELTAVRVAELMSDDAARRSKLKGPDGDYWTVSLEVSCFPTKTAADRYMDILTDAFMAMPESKGLGATASTQSHHSGD